jgi:hypothetical protein
MKDGIAHGRKDYIMKQEAERGVGRGEAGETDSGAKLRSL